MFRKLVYSLYTFRSFIQTSLSSRLSSFIFCGWCLPRISELFILKFSLRAAIPLWRIVTILSYSLVLTTTLGILPYFYLSGRRDSNSRPPEPKSGILDQLDHYPFIYYISNIIICFCCLGWIWTNDLHLIRMTI